MENICDLFFTGNHSKDCREKVQLLNRISLLQNRVESYQVACFANLASLDHGSGLKHNTLPKTLRQSHIPVQFFSYTSAILLILQSKIHATILVKRDTKNTKKKLVVNCYLLVLVERNLVSPFSPSHSPVSLSFFCTIPSNACPKNKSIVIFFASESFSFL